MRHHHLVTLILLCLCGPVHAADVQDTLNELSGELAECGSYFAIASEAISRFSDSEIAGASALAADYKRHAEDMISLAAKNGLNAGATYETLTVRFQQTTANLMAMTNKNFANMAILTQRYQSFCKHLVESTDARFRELQSGNICNSEYRCGQ